MTKPKDTPRTSMHSIVHRHSATNRRSETRVGSVLAEYCGVDPQDRSEWRTEMVGAKKFVRELITIWRKRENQ